MYEYAVPPPTTPSHKFVHSFLFSLLSPIPFPRVFLRPLSGDQGRFHLFALFTFSSNGDRSLFEGALRVFKRPWPALLAPFPSRSWPTAIFAMWLRFDARYGIFTIYFSFIKALLAPSFFREIPEARLDISLPIKPAHLSPQCCGSPLIFPPSPASLFFFFSK